MTYPNGTETEYFYDGLNRLERVENRKSDSTVFSAYEYELGNAGNRLSVTEHTGRVVNYDYDDLYRLVGEAITDPANGNETISYTYDDFGNRLSKTDAGGTTDYHYDDNDRLYAEILPDGTTVSYAYDDNGNTLTKGDGTYTTTYSWDAENRLISVDDGVSVTNYGYDADGIRVSAETDGDVTEYLVDKNRDYAQVLEERDGSGGLIVSYVYGDDLIRQKRGDAFSYYQYDGQLSTRQLTDGSGNVTDTCIYDAFGEVLSQSGNTENSYLYTGEQYDPNAEFYYLRARYYDPAGGRFVSSDPWMGNVYDPPSLHKYFYANENPVMNTDPSGLFTIQELAVTLRRHAELVVSSVVNAPLLVSTAAKRIIANISRPFFRVIGNLPVRSARGRRLDMLDRFIRFFVAQTRQYPTVSQGWFGNLLKRAFPRISWQQHHVAIQGGWYRPGPSQWYPNDIAANRGLRRLADAGFNLMALPRTINIAIGANNSRGVVLTTSVAISAYGSVAWGIHYIYEQFCLLFDELND